MAVLFPIEESEHFGNGGWSPKFETVAVGKVGERHPEKTDCPLSISHPDPITCLPKGWGT